MKFKLLSFVAIAFIALNSFTSLDTKDEAVSHVCTYRMYSNGTFVGYWTLESVPDDVSCSSDVAIRTAINQYNFYN